MIDTLEVVQWIESNESTYYSYFCYYGWSIITTFLILIELNFHEFYHWPYIIFKVIHIDNNDNDYPNNMKHLKVQFLSESHMIEKT